MDRLENMEPIHKTKITDHFRVALKPHDLNKEPPLKKQKKLHGGKENIVVITLDDDEEENKKQLQQHRQQPKRVETYENQEPKPILSVNKYLTPTDIKPNVVDHDRLLVDNILCEPHYALESFAYDRQQELKFKNRKYFDDQITPRSRAILIDWLVHLQDVFSLYHESLYTAVKIADQYLMRKKVPRDQLQLLYMTSILIAVKFEERLSPVDISDLIEQSGKIYNRKQVIRFELDLLLTLNFNIRYPLSFGFLRRFARCTGSDQKTLTLARYILESSLLDGEMIDVLESEVAAASLLLAFKMLHKDWDDTAIFYTGYKQEDLTDLTKRLNELISRPIDKRISTVRTKYSHEVYLSVARIPLLVKRDRKG